jgi:hypothetical protein
LLVTTWRCTYSTSVCFQKICFWLTVLEMKIWIYWSESNSWIYLYLVLYKNWKIWWSKQSFTGLGPEDRCSSWGLNKVLLVLGQRTGAHREDWVNKVVHNRWQNLQDQMNINNQIMCAIQVHVVLSSFILMCVP